MIVDEDTIRRTLDRYQGRMTGDAPLADAVKARVRSDRRKRMAVVGGVMSAVLLVGAAVALDARTSTSSEVASDAPPGKAVGERLGLEPVAFPGAGCAQWVGYEHDWGYCLDGVTEDETELILLSQEIMGYEMTDARVAYVTAMVEYRDYAGATPEVENPMREAELEAIIDENKPLLEPLYEPMDLAGFEGLSGESLAKAAGLIPTKGVDHVGTGAWGIGIGAVNYDLDGLATTEQDGEEWASRLSERNLRTAVVPDVVGLPEAEGVQILESAGFAVEVDHVYESDVPEGVISYQLHRAGQRMLLMNTIEILVSKGAVPTTPPSGAQAIPMPDLVGLSRGEAEEIIRRLDLYGPFTKYTVPGSPNTVVRQEPAAGTDVYGSMGEFPGTMVNLWIG